MLEGLKPPDKLGSCRVALVSSKLDESDKKILEEAIADAEHWPIKTLMKALNDRGLQISATPLTSHRARTCVCFR